VAVITEDTVRALAAFRGADAPVTSCYLDVDGRHFPTHRDVQRAFATLLRRSRLTNGSSPQPRSVTSDLGRMERHIRGYRRSDARGLAMFSCSAHDLWQVHELPVRVTSQLVVNQSPCVTQLEDVLSRAGRVGVLLVDRYRARMLIYELGDLHDIGEAVDDGSRPGGEKRDEMVKTRVSSRVHQQARQHLKHAAQLAFDAYQRSPFDYFVISVMKPEARSELMQLLHPYLRERLSERLTVSPNASVEQVRDVAAQAEERVERRREAALVARIRDSIGTGRGAVGGLRDTLRALCDHRVERLVVSRGYAAEGWHCSSCGRLAAVGRRCPACGAEMHHAADVVEDAVQEALVQRCHVDVLVGNADLDVLGGMGAVLRF
jgi:peptide subunit release factor 1 (eRF1)